MCEWRQAAQLRNYPRIFFRSTTDFPNSRTGVVACAERSIDLRHGVTGSCSQVVSASICSAKIGWRMIIDCAKKRRQNVLIWSSSQESLSWPFLSQSRQHLPATCPLTVPISHPANETASPRSSSFLLHARFGIGIFCPRMRWAARGAGWLLRHVPSGKQTNLSRIRPEVTQWPTQPGHVNNRTNNRQQHAVVTTARGTHISHRSLQERECAILSCTSSEIGRITSKFMLVYMATFRHEYSSVRNSESQTVFVRFRRKCP